MKDSSKAILLGTITVILIFAVGYGIYVSAKSGTTTASSTTAPVVSTTASTTPTTSTPSNTSGTISAATLATHSVSGSDCWVAISGSVYNVTSYSHPRLDPFTCGTDNTAGWNSIGRHSNSLLSLVEYVGKFIA
jgi:cytochrome b involved in lipid metabolism